MATFPTEIMFKLKAAVREGNQAKIQDILSTLGVNYFRAHISESQMLLCKSLTRGRTDICKVLLEYGAAVNNIYGRISPFHLACVTGNVEMVETLLKIGEVDINSRDFRGETPLQYSVNLSRIKTYVSEIFEKSDDILYKDQIHNYCMNISVKIAKILLENGAHINLSDECKVTPLHIACETGNFEGVKLLLKHNADFNMRNVSGKTCLHYCIERGSHHLNSLEIIKLLVVKGFNVNSVDNYGWSPLHSAVSKGFGNRVIPPPFSCSRLIRSIEMTKYLLDNGANTRIKDFRGETPLHHAVKTENAEKVELILSRNPEINSKDEKGETALYKANRSHNTDIARLLLKFGADPNVQSNTGDTVLHCALVSREESVNLFLNYNADITLVNNKGKSPLDIALELTPEHFCYNSRQIILIHANKLKAAGLGLYERSVQSLMTVKDHKYNFFSYEKCEREIRLMKRSFLFNDITYYDILKVSNDKLVNLINNNKIEEQITTEKYKTAFPYYADMLDRKIFEALERRRLVSLGHEFFALLEPKLSFDCIENIIKNLNNRDLKLLRRCV